MPDNEFIPASLRIGRIGASAEPRPEVPFDVLLRGINSNYGEWITNSPHWDRNDTRNLIISMKVALERLRKELETLHQRIKDIKEGFEGCCNACEPVGEMNKQLREERDEARRMWCEAAPVGNSLSVDDMDRRARTEAKRRGWDCFPDKTEADANNTLFRTTDGE